ncbi:hypothetical protein CY34DRAFT_174389 [Suillus luteus UH-Slu-Lm8-n1]|uniref:Unplaced genomic scaffold CY34scaffold_121, whole genome shotgun sequence n=1 Tax=Suillus luteus UH-Slu-Lm8-n1 TaxID=930992 RepID=A0A0C9ZVW1_9AGAM|nr:hypothetical protein CY34DRAFT_174389 [Suillus luteus UH-Slu-Lm8-n1]
MSSPSFHHCFDEYIVSCAFVHPNPMRRPLQHHSNTPSVPLPQSGAVTSHMGQLSPPPNPDPNLSAGPKTYLIYYVEGIDRTSSCKRSRSLTQRASLGTTTQERRSQLPAHLDLPILIPHHHQHLQLILPRHPPLSPVLLGQQEQFRVLISLLLDGGLVSWPGFAACPFRTQTVTISEATFWFPCCIFLSHLLSHL